MSNKFPGDITFYCLEASIPKKKGLFSVYYYRGNIYSTIQEDQIEPLVKETASEWHYKISSTLPAHCYQLKNTCPLMLSLLSSAKRSFEEHTTGSTLLRD